jgi:hypothetical protein
MGQLYLVDAREMAVHEWLIGQGPQMLGGLQFWQIWRQEREMHMVRDPQALRAVPAGAIEDEVSLLRRRLLGQTRPVRLRRARYSRSSPGGTACGLRQDGQSRRDSASRSDAVRGASGRWSKVAMPSPPADGPLRLFTQDPEMQALWFLAFLGPL